ncbi:MAG: hypothetical protein OHK0013_48920 [Sandaracinaceae bacterium]
MRGAGAVAIVLSLSFAASGCGSGSAVVRLLEDQHERARLVTLAGDVTMEGASGAPIVVSVLRVPECSVPLPSRQFRARDSGLSCTDGMSQAA